MSSKLRNYLTRHKRITPVDQHEFNSSLVRVWQSAGRPKTIGIALSGGVDSMALAMLCHKARASFRHHPSKEPPPAFRAFIVDHGARPNSAEEAKSVHEEVAAKTSIDVEIIRLLWGDYNPAENKGNFETMARKLRYRALARACIRNDVNVLLVGHHADDAAETVLTRLYAGYTGTGLAGIQQGVSIPESHDIYGVKSGKPWTPSPSRTSNSSRRGAISPVRVESGALELHRPLLDTPKSQLISTCEETGIAWFEDATNMDRTLTVRNTARHLLNGDRLPLALQTPALLSLAEQWRVRKNKWEQEASSLLRHCRIKLHLATGAVDVHIPEVVLARLRVGGSSEAKVSNTRHAAAILVQRLVVLCSPADSIDVDKVDQPLLVTFPFLFSDVERAKRMPSTPIATVAGVRWEVLQDDADAPSSTRSHPSPASRHVRLTRVLSPRGQQRTRTHPLTLLSSPTPASSGPDVSSSLVLSSSTQPQLFDSRWWISLRHIPRLVQPGTRISVRSLGDDELAALKRRIFAAQRLPHTPIGEQRRGLWSAASLRDVVRLTLPAIVVSTARSREEAAAAAREEQRGREGRAQQQRKRAAADDDGAGKTLAGGGGGEGEAVGMESEGEEVVALPTLGWAASGWAPHRDGVEPPDGGWTWEVAYKAVDFGRSGLHSFVR